MTYHALSAVNFCKCSADKLSPYFVNFLVYTLFNKLLIFYIIVAIFLLLYESLIEQK
jgi:hypothetical protein